MLKRLFDLVVSAAGIAVFSPVFIFLSLLIALESQGGVFYRQVRVGRKGKPFRLLKFRTMHTGADNEGLLTVGMRDNRITRVGYYLRKYKLDELPQLFNVLTGEMSMVGPRPEVPKYVAFYNEEQLKVLNVKPGITDYASVEYSRENELLGKAINPENTYLNEIMPSKIKLNLKYIKKMGLLTDIGIILKTLGRIISG